MRLLYVVLSAAALAQVGQSKNCDGYLDVLQYGTDVCAAVFNPFTECFVSNVEDGIQTVLDEASLENIQAAAQCFGESGCQASFDADDIMDTFLPCAETSEKDKQNNCPWRYAVELLIDAFKAPELSEQQRKQVGTCMLTYFKGIGERKIEQCVAEYGNVNPQFYQSPIPGFEDFELDEIKNLLLYHISIRYNLGKCTDCSATSKPDLIPCLSSLALDDSQSVCESKEECEQPVKQSSCARRAAAVQNALCSCIKAKIDEGLEGLANSKELKNLIIKGHWECRLEECYTNAGAPEGSDAFNVMVNRVKALKRAAVSAFAKLQSGNAPPQLSEAIAIFKNVIDEISNKYSGLFCGSCEQKESASFYRAQAYNAFVSADACEDATAVYNLNKGPSVFGQVNADDRSAIDEFFGKK